MSHPVRIEHLVISRAHVYVGHFGGPPGTEPAVERSSVRLVPGRGLEGDRYVVRDEGHPKQLTFFAMEVLEELARFRGSPVPPTAVRRNVFTRGLDLPSLIGRRFELAGALFEGVEHCRPCFWMESAVARGAEELLAPGKGGLRARILAGDSLSVGDASWRFVANEEER